MRQMEVEAVNDWFSWNGVKCTEYGIHVLEQPPPTIPLERVSCTSVPGRPGSLTILEGEAVYDDMTLSPPAADSQRLVYVTRRRG